MLEIEPTGESKATRNSQMTTKFLMVPSEKRTLGGCIVSMFLSNCQQQESYCLAELLSFVIFVVVVFRRHCRFCSCIVSCCCNDSKYSNMVIVFCQSTDHNHEPCKNCCTNQDTIWDLDSCRCAQGPRSHLGLFSRWYYPLKNIIIVIEQFVRLFDRFR